MYYDDDSEDVWQRDELDLEPEYDVLQRGGYFQHDVLGTINEQYGFIDVKKGENIIDPIQRFYVYVQATGLKLVSEKFIPNVKSDEIGLIIDKISGMKNIQYKNPTAIILGYALTKSSTIDKKLFNELIPKIKTLEPPMKPTDLLRYSNLWLNVNSY
jgi:hypothetical protein